MRKLHLALLLTSSSLLITSCQNNLKVNNGRDGSSSISNRNGGVTDSDSVYISIECDDGCLVSGDGQTYQKSYKAYVPYESNLRFDFQKTSEEYGFPSLLSAVNDETGYDKDTFTYEYSSQSGSLRFAVPESSKNVNKITFEANTLDPAVELRFDNAEESRLPIKLAYSGLIKAVDLGDGKVIDGSQFQSGFIEGFVTFTTGEKNMNGYVKIFGNLSSLDFIDIPKEEAEREANDYLTEVYFNHGVESFDYRMFDTCYAVEKIYIGPDVKEMIYSPSYSQEVMAEDIRVNNLEKIEVSSDNPYLDSRDNCGCLINSKTNELILGGGEGFIPSNVTSIGPCAFATNRLLDYIDLPDSITDIGDCAFFRSSVSYIEFSSNLKMVGEAAFAQCDLEYVDLSRMSHAPYMMYSCFEKAAFMRQAGGDVYPIYPILHYNSYDMNTIVDELISFDETWGMEREKLFAMNEQRLPSFVCVNKLHKDLERLEKTSMGLNPAQDVDPYSSYGAILAGEESIRDGIKMLEYEVPYNERLSSYCTAVYAKRADRTPAHIDPIFGDRGMPFYDNGKDIVFIKYFGYYAGEEIEGDYTNKINNYTFCNLTALEHFEFTKRLSIGGKPYPYSLITEIGEYAFANTSITSIELPSSLINVGDGAFMNCTKLKDLTFEKIGRTYQDLPEQEQYKNYLALHAYVFAGDTGIEKLDFPWFIDFFSNEEKGISLSNPFVGCTSIKTILCPSGKAYEHCKYIVAEGGEFEGCLVRMDDGLCVCCPSNFSKLLDEMKLSDGFYGTTTMPYIVANIVDDRMAQPQAYAFAYSMAKRIRLTNTSETKIVTRLQPYMFAYCPNLEVIDLRGLVNPMEEGTFEEPFKDTNENFKIWVNSEDDKGRYGKLFHFDDEEADARIIVKTSI